MKASQRLRFLCLQSLIVLRFSIARPFAEPRHEALLMTAQTYIEFARHIIRRPIWFRWLFDARLLRFVVDTAFSRAMIFAGWLALIAASFEAVPFSRSLKLVFMLAVYRSHRRARDMLRMVFRGKVYVNAAREIIKFTAISTAYAITVGRGDWTPTRRPQPGGLYRFLHIFSPAALHR